MKFWSRFSAKSLLACAALACAALSAAAAEWSDTALSYRYGTKFREPFVNAPDRGPLDIAKNIFALTHSSGFKYGTNYFNVDMLMSDENDPASCANNVCTGAAQEVYVLYRYTLDLGKVSGKDLKTGFVRGWGATTGFDFNAKTDAGYNSKKRMLVLGPTAIARRARLPQHRPARAVGEQRAVHHVSAGRLRRALPVQDARHADGRLGIPLGGTGLSFEGYANFIAAKGKNEFGADTVPETNIDTQVMYDLSRVGMGSKGTFKAGFEYQYWKNKFGNDASGPAGPGAFAKTPMIRAEYHF